MIVNLDVTILFKVISEFLSTLSSIVSSLVSPYKSSPQNAALHNMFAYVQVCVSL